MFFRAHEKKFDRTGYYLSTYLSSRNNGYNHPNALSAIAKGIEVPDKEEIIEYGINCIRKIFSLDVSDRIGEDILQNIKAQMNENELMLLQLSTLLQLSNCSELINKTSTDASRISSIQENNSFNDGVESSNPYILLSYSNLLESHYKNCPPMKREYLAKQFTSLASASNQISDEYGIFGRYVKARINSLFAHALLDKVKSQEISSNRLFNTISSSSELLANAGNELKEIEENLSQISLIDQMIISSKIDNSQSEIKNTLKSFALIVNEDQNYCKQTGK